MSRALKVISFIVIILIFAFCGPISASPDIQVMKNITSVPMTFTENKGQWDEQVLFRADAGGATMWFTEDGTVYQFIRTVSNDNDTQTHPPLMGPEGMDIRPDSIESIAIKAFFVGANSNPRMIGSDKIEYKCNYFYGNEPDRWYTDVPNFNSITYREIYPGIDLKYYGNGKQMEYDFIISPGADPSVIQIKYDGIQSLSVNSDGELVVETEWGEIIEKRPVVYQIKDGVKKAIEGEYLTTNENSFGFQLDSDYDPALPLVIDPVLTYSTYLGGNSDDYGRDIAVDDSGNAYIFGETQSYDFPMVNPYDGSNNGSWDVFVTKLNSTGDGLVYSTYLGGISSDFGYGGITVDDSGNAYISGVTNSSDFPTTAAAYQTSIQGSNDIFAAKLNMSGNGLVYSTYLGGSSIETCYSGFSIDNSGNAYISGSTQSSNFPTTMGAYQPSLQGVYDVFVAKLNYAGSDLIYSTYLGGNNYDYGRGLAVDAFGSAYILGYTQSSNFPTTLGAFQTSYQGSSDIFVTKLNVTGTGLDFSTYLGGSNADYSYGDIITDDSGNAYVTGMTQSTNFPVTAGAFQTVYQGGAYDAFVSKVSSTGALLLYSTYMGGGGDDYCYDIAIDNNNCAYLGGYTVSSDFPATFDAFQTSFQGGSWDGFIVKLNSIGDSLQYSSYLGGSSDDYGTGIIVDNDNSVIMAGLTQSVNFPTLNAYDSTFYSAYEVFVAKFTGDSINHPPVLVAIGSHSVEAGSNLNFSVYATDPDGPVPSLSVSALPSGASFADYFDGHGVFDWTPTMAQLGDYYITFYAEDDSLAVDSEIVYIAVNSSDYTCGDANDDGWVNILDVLGIIGHLYGASLLPVEDAGDVDGYIGVTNNDAHYLIYYLYCGGPAPFCPGTPASFPVSQDTLEIRNNLVIPGASNCAVELYLKSVDNINSLAFPFTFGCPTSDISCTAIDIAEPLTSYWYQDGLVDNDSSKGIIGIVKSSCNTLEVTDGTLATIWFSITPSTEVQTIYIDTTTYDPGNVTVISRNGQGYTPVIINNDSVPPVNHPPVLDSIGSQTVNVGETLQFGITATDPDGTIPDITASLLPSGSYVQDNGDGTGTFNWMPDSNQVGIHYATILAIDDSAAVDSEVVEITVSITFNNHPPVLDSIGPQSVEAGQTLQLDITATDPDDNISFLTISTVPSNASFTDYGDGTARLTWTPHISQVGDHYLAFYAYDDSMAVDSEVVQFTITDPDFVCGDANGDGSVNIGDAVYLVNYLFSYGPEPVDMQAVDVDGYAGVTNNDVHFYSGYIFCGGPGPICSPVEEPFPISDDTLEIRSNIVPPGMEHCQVDLWLNAVSPLGGFSFSFAYGCSTSVITCDSISFDGSAFEWSFYTREQTDHLSSGVVATGGICNNTPAGEGLFASIWFTVPYSPDTQYILIDTCAYPPSNTTVLSRDGMGYVPVIENLFTPPPPGHLPVLDSIGSFSVRVNTELDFDISALDPDGTIPELSVYALPAGASFVDNGDGTGHFNWTPASVQTGMHHLTFYAYDSTTGSDSEVVEINVYDLMPDLSITSSDITILPESPYEGQDVLITALIRNTGAEYAENFEVQIASDPAFSFQLDNPVTVGYLAAGGNTIIQFHWVADPSVHYIFVRVDANNSVTEESEMNNKAARYIYVSSEGSLYLFIYPNEQTAELRDTVHYNMYMLNRTYDAQQVALDVTGLELFTWDMQQDTITVLPGSYAFNQLTIVTSSDCFADTGLFNFDINGVSVNNPGVNISAGASLTINSSPEISNILPADDQTMASNNVTFMWTTRTSSTSSIFYRLLNDIGYTEVTGADGIDHIVELSDLDYDTTYVWYIQSTSECGTATSELFAFHTARGAVFSQSGYYFSIRRSYDQRATVTVNNYDTSPHEILVEVINPYDDLIAGFTGDGSLDQTIELLPGGSADLDFRMHAQDVVDTNYNLAFRLTSTGDDNSKLYDYASAYIHVQWPDTNFVLTDLGLDSLTLVRSMRLSNIGDTITDFYVTVEDAVGIDYFMVPTIEHALLGPGGYIDFQLFPTFQDTVSAAKASCEATVVATGAGKTVTYELTDCCDEDVFLVQKDDALICSNHSVHTWYCTNRPVIGGRIYTPIIPSGAITNGILSVTFSPHSDVNIHTVSIYLNGYLVGRLENMVPNGTYEFDIDPSYINVSSTSPAVNILQLVGSGFHSGHYVVGTGFSMCLCIDSYSEYICATNGAEALTILESRPYLYDGHADLVEISSPTDSSDVSMRNGTSIVVNVEPPHQKYNVTADIEYTGGSTQSLELNYTLSETYTVFWRPAECEDATITVTVEKCGEPVTTQIDVHVNDCQPEILVRDGANNIITNETFTLAKLYDDYPDRLPNDPRTIEEFSQEITTDANGRFILPANIYSGDNILLRKQIFTEESDRHPEAIPNLYNIIIDNGVFGSENGHLYYQEITDALFQIVSLHHTMIAYDLVISVEWDADEQYLNSLLEGIRLTDNFMYDVTDGQSYIANILIGDDKEFWDDCDIRIHTANDVWPNNNRLTNRINMPRFWLGDRTISVNASYFWFETNTIYPGRGDLDLTNPYDYRTRMHELGHNLWGFWDEYEFVVPEPDEEYNLGFMDHQYEDGGEWSSEMSTIARYLAAPSIWYFDTYQFYFTGRDCWSDFEDDFEGNYGGIYAEIIKPDERFIGGVPTYFFGPNDNPTQPNVNVGEYISDATVNNNSSNGAEITVLVLEETGDIPLTVPGIRIRTGEDVAWYQDAHWVSQGQTGNFDGANGRIRCLGVHDGDVIDGSGINQTISGETWLSGHITVTQGKENKSLAGREDVEFTLQSLSSEVKAFISASVNSDSTVMLNVFSTMYDTLAPVVSLLDSLIEPQPLTWNSSSYDLLWPGNPGSEGVFVVEAIGDSAKEFFVDCSWKMSSIDNTLFSHLVRGPNNSRLKVDSTNQVLQNILILESAFPAPRDGLDNGMFRIGPIYSISSSNGNMLPGLNNYLTLFFNEIDFNENLHYPGWQERLRIFYWDDILTDWQRIGGIIDTTTNLITASIDRTGTYAIYTLPDYPDIYGHIGYYDMSKSVPDVYLTLNENGGEFDTTSNYLGNYSFADIRPDDYNIVPSKTSDDDGVSVADCVKIRRHLATLEIFDSPYKLVSADVNGSGGVSVADIVKIRRFLAHLDTLPTGNWIFIDSAFEITSENWMTAPESIPVSVIAGDILGQNFVGVRMGDVNNTWNQSKTARPSPAMTRTIKVDDAIGQPGDEILVPINIEENSIIAGLELHLTYDYRQLEFNKVTSILPTEPTTNIDNGTIHIVWENIDDIITADNSQAIMTLHFKITNKFENSTDIKFAKTELVDVTGAPYNLTSHDGKVLKGESKQEETVLPKQFALEQNRPNPFNPITEIRFSLPEACDVRLEIFNIMGQRVNTLVNKRLEAGHHSYSWDASNYASGIYFTRLRAGTFVDSKKMILLK